MLVIGGWLTGWLIGSSIFTLLFKDFYYKNHITQNESYKYECSFSEFMVDERTIIKQFIVRKLYRHRMWLHKHTNIHNLPKGLSNELRVSREVKKAIEELLKEGILFSKPTHYGLEVSLNPQKRQEIEELIQ